MELKDRFKAGGIPIFVDVDYSLRDVSANGTPGIYRSASSPPSFFRINVCLDEQFEEAKLLLNDPGYQVKHPVDIASFDAEMKKLGANKVPDIKIPVNYLNLISLFIFMGFIFWLFYHIIFS
ncbi:hypothetical protein [Methyloradius palustris]|uniref:Uncharacterized protein n=1 Tax=Methyloradius palustris TaxID=2778876 RepID=A0A8D5FZW7_9PROT|nr:hypothetical protein [Methyloradius palustris]BCM25369.1 hypothetical protein ZMTM_16280 [Methyloradius palustris]